MACLFCVVVVCLVFLFSVVVVGVLFWFSLFFFPCSMGHGVRLKISFLMVDREMEVEALTRTNTDVLGEAGHYQPLLVRVIGRFFDLIQGV